MADPPRPGAPCARAWPPPGCAVPRPGGAPGEFGCKSESAILKSCDRERGLASDRSTAPALWAKAARRPGARPSRSSPACRGRRLTRAPGQVGRAPGTFGLWHRRKREATMAEFVFLVLCLAGAFALAMHRAPLWAWALALAGVTLIWQTGLLDGEFEEPSFGLASLLAWVPVVILAGLAVPSLRRAALIEPLFNTIKGVLPKVSATEQEALEAGSIGFDAELFSGTPDWQKLRDVPPITLSEQERAFLEGPTNELCRMLNDWAIRHNLKEIPAEVWSFIKQHGFLGMLISKEHGGLGFSPQAQSL